jgi:hypothetical protein
VLDFRLFDFSAVCRATKGRSKRLRLSALLTAIVNEQLHGNADFYGGPVAKKDYHEYYM